MNWPTSTWLPVIPGRNVVVYPGRTVPLSIGRRKSVAAIASIANGEPWLITVSQRRDENRRDNADVGTDDLHRIGTLCKVEGVRGSGGKDGYQIVVRGIARIELGEVRESSGENVHYEASWQEIQDDEDADEQTVKALRESLKKLALETLQLIPADTRQLAEFIEGVDDLTTLVHLSAEHLDVPLAKKQEILETRSVKSRALMVLDLLNGQKQSLELQSSIREKLSRKMGKMQRETILREQLRAIREELGEEPESPEVSLTEKAAASGMPEAARKLVTDEAKRLEQMGTNHPESHVIRTWIDLLNALPWSQSSEDRLELDIAQQTLDQDHYGLEKIKKRIIQHLAVMKLRKGGKGSILLFVGPPGVGKTSLGQSIAKALGRSFVRASLGGVRDEADIRGHRRTYIGAMPGRIMQGIKRAGVNNPVFLLDEIDKMGRGWGGDPAGALLEVLDPEQNGTFTDHYVDTPFDLSKVFFIATANSLETIPPALLDRMEVIDVSGYTTPEKLHIAKSHLLPKQLGEHGLTADQMSISDEALVRLISAWTREAGVRDLQRKIGELCRAAAVRVLEKNESVRLETKDLEDVLGPERFTHEVAERIMPPGVATGLAWTPHGGEILFIESTIMPGTNQLTLTGQLGDVMKESARIALSLLRSQLPTMVPGFDYAQKDIHIHVPAGAIPKDGPSAGVTMLTSLASLFSGRRISPKLAMTGEITLRGAVTPVGGIKEKVLAAHRAGIEQIILSSKNAKDLRDVPEDVKSQIKFELVDTVDDVLRIALGLGPSPDVSGLRSNPALTSLTTNATGQAPMQ
jgi:ATP-dependent Lon protease